jgi:hypothetical protein
VSHTFNPDLNLLENLPGPEIEPNFPAYKPTSPHYEPTSPAYKPTSPGYESASPHYEPISPGFTYGYEPTSPDYKPTAPYFDPTAPYYSPTNYSPINLKCCVVHRENTEFYYSNSGTSLLSKLTFRLLAPGHFREDFQVKTTLQQHVCLLCIITILSPIP